MALYYGVDVSHYQGSVNWADVAAAGITFGIAQATVGTGYVDPTYNKNYLRMLSNGIIPGAYHFWRQSDGHGATQANNFCDTIGNNDMLMALDVENRYGVPVWSDITDFISRFQVRMPGRTLIIYSAGYVWTAIGGNPNGQVLGTLLWNAFWSGLPVSNATWNSPGYGHYDVSTFVQYGTDHKVGLGYDGDVYQGTLANLQALTQVNSAIVAVRSKHPTMAAVASHTNPAGITVSAPHATMASGAITVQTSTIAVTAPSAGMLSYALAVAPPIPQTPDPQHHGYRVLIYKAELDSTTFGVGPLLAEFENVKNLGWSKYLNDVGEAFWTINQDDPKLVGLRPYIGTAHVKIVRTDRQGNNEVVWRGILGEHDATSRDVIMYAYEYASVLYHLQTKWNQSWKDAQLDTIITALWNRAKGNNPSDTDFSTSYSQLGFATTGTIEAPVTTSGGATPIVLPSYKTYYKRILFSMKELTAIATSDTTNTCFFELAHSTLLTDNAITFNVWKNRSTDQTSMLWEYGSGNVREFADRYAPLLSRNDIFGVGSGAHNQLFRENQPTATGNRGYQTFGRRMEPIYLQWVRDDADLLRVTKLRAAKALRSDVDVILMMMPDSVTPIGSADAQHALGDRIKIRIDKGLTQIDKFMFLVGEQVLYLRGAEYVRPMLADRNGT